MTQPLKTAVLLTGAAARISQEVAVLDKLMEKKMLKLSQSDTLLAGFSSGSLNISAINACFRDVNPLSWEIDYKKNKLFKLKSKQVYKIRRLPFDTTPLRKLLNNFLKQMNYSLMKDLAFNSYVLTFSREELETLWANSVNPGQEYLYLSDVFMASTAIPVVFPAQEINCEKGHNTDFPGWLYNDGGTGGTFKKFEDHLGKYVEENGAFNDMFIISPMRERKGEDVYTAFKSMRKLSTHTKSIAEHSMGNFTTRSFQKFLVRLKEWNDQHGAMAKNIYVCIPDMPKNFPFLDFDHQKEQYKAVCKWAEKNPDSLAIPLDKYIESFS